MLRGENARWLISNTTPHFYLERLRHFHKGQPMC